MQFICIAVNIFYNKAMQPETAEQLIKLNHQFYQTFADHFSETRQRLQPGVSKVIKSILLTANILDLGCGNGLIAARLKEHGYTGNYVGLDTAAGLIQIARDQHIPNTQFFQADLMGGSWVSKLPQPTFETIVCFAVMHHIPGSVLRLQFLEHVRRLIVPTGIFLHSNWQFLQSKKLRGRIQPWEKIGLTKDKVDEHDYLMDWRRGGEGLRYVHYFTESELNSLADQTGFTVQDSFYSDGASGNLGLYQIWKPK
jgi:SAM-dependent methyltransferase